MPLQPLTFGASSEAEAGQILYDPDYFNAGDLRHTLELEEPATEITLPEMPGPLGAAMENGATLDEAIAAARETASTPGFFDDPEATDQSPLASGDLEAMLTEIEEEARAMPEEAVVDPALANANLAALALFRIEEEGGNRVIYADGELIFQAPMRLGAMSNFDKVVLFIQTVLDSIGLGLALLNVGVKAGKSWAKKVAKKLGQVKSWYKKANKAFGHFTKAYNYYKNARDEGNSSKKAMGKKEVLKAFAAAFVKFLGFIGSKAYAIMKALFAIIFDSWIEAGKMLLKLGIAVAKWVGTAGAAIVQAVLEAILAAIAVIEDVVAWQKA